MRRACLCAVCTLGAGAGPRGSLWRHTEGERVPPEGETLVSLPGPHAEDSGQDF